MSRIDHAHLRRLDLNLLLALDALLSEASVTRAAERLGLGQPAMSHALARLRGLFGDPLLVRAGAGMTLSARARALAGPLREALGRLQGLLVAAGDFDPATAAGVFRLAVTAHVEAAIFPRLLADLADRAPGVRLVAWQPPRADWPGLLDAGEIDLALGVIGRRAAGGALEPLYREGFVLAYDPAFGPVETLDAFLARPHALITTQADLVGRLDRILARRGLARRVTYSTASAATLAQVLAGTPLVACAPQSSGPAFVRLGLAVGPPPPLDLGRFQVSLAWHGRDQTDPASQWLRERIRAAAAVAAVA